MRFVQLIKANHAQEFYDNNGIFANASVTAGKGKEEKIDADSSVYHKQVWSEMERETIIWWNFYRFLWFDQIERDMKEELCLLHFYWFQWVIYNLIYAGNLFHRERRFWDGTEIHRSGARKAAKLALEVVSSSLPS